MIQKISQPIEKIKNQYEAVVIGSGYGGAIAASRLSRAGIEVCLLERGKEIRPGEFPNKEISALEEVQANYEDKQIGPKNGLFDFHFNKDINVLVGCGLGGTSLINANVSLRAVPEVFQDPAWPKNIREEASKHGFDPYYSLAEEMLRPNPIPNQYRNLAKHQALKTSASFLKKEFYPTPINVTFQSKINHVGVKQEACTNCGDCVTGCNVSSKNTTLMNYLPDAANFGAQIFTEVKVSYIEKQEDSWLIHFVPLGLDREKFSKDELFIRAKTVILSAGSLGSTEILLRSKEKGLNVSDSVGVRFSGNGDMLGFSYNGNTTINGIGFGSKKTNTEVGPCITGVIDTRKGASLNEGMIIEEGSIPGAIRGQLPEIFAIASKLTGVKTKKGFFQWVIEKIRIFLSFILGSYRGAVKNTQTYLVMAHDGNDGKMFLQNDRLRISWPNVGKKPIFEKISTILKEATVPLQGTYIKNPVWNRLTDQDLISVHPLGGCPMGDDASTSAVNENCQVYSGKSGKETYNGLYIMDGSVIPRSLGVNPLLTICAISERACEKLISQKGLTINYNLPSYPKHTNVPNEKTLGIEFTECMKGFFSTQSKEDTERGYQIGKDEGSSIEFLLTIRSENLNEMISNPDHKATLFGTVKAPVLSKDVITVTNGEFLLFISREDKVETRNMVYRMILNTEEGKKYLFVGAKWIQNDGLTNIWRDTSTLFTTIYEGETENSPVLGKGILHILPEDFAKQMTTMKVIHAKSLIDTIQGLTKFGSFFAGALYDVYGGVASSIVPWDKDARPRTKRPLRVSSPEVHFFKAEDGANLRLLRYKGGNKGPVLLSPGLGVSSLIFSIDTIDTNLLEYLFENQYDVWLFDYRTSIALPSAPLPNTGDAIATKDYPAAVNKVRELTKVDKIQVVAHCFGATTFTMALLSGLEGVRSVVLSQISADVEVPTSMDIKVGFHTAEILDVLGIKDMTAYTSNHDDWLDRFFNSVLALQPQSLFSHDVNPVSRRISFLYGSLYRLENLNEETYRYGLGEMFGVSNIKAFEHLSKMIRAHKVVNSEGQDVYVPHLDRLNLPITFIHGAQNRCYLPESTETTYKKLIDRFNPNQYRRHVIPDYGHIDCIFGKDAYKDVYPFILQSLNRY
ncbi:GMC oxidoreductase [Leptospira interrogans serovar Grippotyphosa str. UI 12769]|uniref:Cholesterol oxidase n=2 Tax=Leptospira interrogans TaxID=173 RepID=A0AAQ0AZ81_LEPIR|nr:alpha/beta fold hydrolase [Leptospira interrogans]AJR15893.1 cholesterol oxidase [Leptospira interrogans serovar Linhai str. 56609]EKR44311.1 GMC oxidoreductase [Leptospira interrogans serovar Grippotyphosa str. UI 08368]EMN68294.1 GMC oxidoreductase [Leptospira interrogans serovar Grippotyphosa str. UI 08434]EMN84770.1 GMC oxidoreductase [Leptospira interrogans serovar Grippotyphosa str. UI 12769]EMO93314.1 GMC oxidoreductase [Leptospira interrogans str. UI 13372]